MLVLGLILTYRSTYLKCPTSRKDQAFGIETEAETEQIRIEMKSPFNVAYFHLCAFITRQQIRKENAINTICHENQLTWLTRFINLQPKLKFVNFDSQMGVNLNGFNSELWKYAISTGTFYFILICSIFFQI